MDEAYCSDCRRITQVDIYATGGDTVCTECGLVLESHSIDDTAEWRVFANDSGDNDNDPIRVGAQSNPLLTDVALSTFTSQPIGGKWQSRSFNNNRERRLILAFENISAMCDRLGLVKTIKDRTSEIYKKVSDLRSSTSTRGGGRNQVAISAACLYIACRQEDKPRTVKEIACVTDGATMKEISRASKYIVKQLEVVEMGRSAYAGDFIGRFCSNLGIGHKAVKATQEAVQNVGDLDIRRNPASIAATIIYIITQLSDDKKLVKDISMVTGAAEGTIKDVYKDIYPHVSKIVPSWYAKEADLWKLRSP